MSEKKKKAWLFAPLGCLMAGTGCGVPFIPGVWGAKLPGIPYPRFVLGSSESGQELHIPAKDLIRNKGLGEIPFSKINMQWGFRPLKNQDALISSCKDGKKFYVGTHIWGEEYRLHSGKRFSGSKNNCCCNDDTSGEEKSITLNSSFKKKNGGTGGSTQEISKLMLVVGTCKFKLNQENSTGSGKLGLTMTCTEGYTDSGSGGSPSTKEEVTLTLDSSNYQLRYIQKSNQSTHQ